MKIARYRVGGLALFLMLVTVLSLPGLGLAQQPDDALRQLQTTTIVWAQLDAHIAYEGSPASAWALTGDDSYLSMDSSEQQAFTADSSVNVTTNLPVSWSGRRFSLQFSEKTRDPSQQFSDTGYNETPCSQVISIQGEVSADGLTVESLSGSTNFSCVNDSDQVYDAEQITLALRGAVPFVGVVESADKSMAYCAEYALAGDMVEPTITQVAERRLSRGDDRTLMSVDYTRQPQLRVRLCGPSPLALQGEALPPGAVWELVGTDSSLGLDPEASKDCRQLEFAGPADKLTPWGEPMPANTAICQISFFGDCNAAIHAGGITSSHSWTHPGSPLSPGSDLTLNLGITVSGDSPDASSAAAQTQLWLDEDHMAATLGDGTLLGATGDRLVWKTPHPGKNCEGFDLACQHSGESTAQVRWTVPAGKLGDRMSLAFSVHGPACGGAYLYIYELHAFERLATPQPAAAPESTTGDPGQDGSPDGAAAGDLLGMLPAGFDPDGFLPGPDSLAQALAGMFAPAVVISMLAALGRLGGPDGGPGSGDGGSPPPGAPREMTLTDAEGRTFGYEWNAEYGGYINPETGGMLDQSQWAEYNRNLAGNRKFNEEQREKVAQPTPRTAQQEYDSVSQLAERMIAGIPSRAGGPLQDRLEEIKSRVTGQGLSTQDIADLKELTRTAWEGYRDRQEGVRREAMELENSLGRWQTGLEVTAAVGKICGMVAEGMLGGSGFVTGFLYGAAENCDKGAGSMLGNGLIGGAFGWAGTRLGNLNPSGITWNAATGGLTGAGAAAATDYVNEGKVDTHKVVVGAAVGAAGGALGAATQRWLGGADLPPGSEPDLPSGRVAGEPDVVRAPVRPAPDVIPPPKDIPLSQQPASVRTMFSNVEFGPDGRPYARLSDVLKVQRSSTDMRALKNAPPEVREAFNNTLRRDVYGRHDDQLVEWVSRNVPQAKGRPVRVDDFRTPGSAGNNPRAINTDRDYRVLMQNEKGEWIEVRKELWQGKSHEIFGECTGFDPNAVRAAHPEVDWDRLTPEQQLAKQREMWADSHQQLATDRASIEASPDYSDQGVIMGREAQITPNILDVKHGHGTLKDADAIGQMYYEKVAASLRRNNAPEAVAQAQKAVRSLWDVRNGYAMQRLPVGNLPSNLNQAMHLIQNAPVDHRATAEAMAGLNQQLAGLGFPEGVDQVARAMSAQFSALRFVGA